MSHRDQHNVVIVTGGATSIGSAIVRRFHADGARVVIADIKDEPGEALAAELGERAMYVDVDITRDDQLDRLVKSTLVAFGGLGCLINNACAYGDDGAGTTRDTWLGTMNVNVVSAALLGERARPHLAAAKGSIINIGSISGQFPHIGRWAYPVSKAALAHLTRTQAVEYAGDGIRVNMVALGFTWSGPFEALTGNDRAHADRVCVPYNLLGRIADPEEAAEIVAFVASPKASYVTGAVVPADGGYSAMGPEQHYPLMPLLMKKRD